MSSMRVSDSSKNKRPHRIAAEILRDVPEILRRHVDLPAGVIVSITDVEVTDDLSFARIFFSVLGEHETETSRDIEQILNSRKGVVRHELAQRLVMRQHPDIRFMYDSTPARAARIEALLKQVRESTNPESGENE